ncbi:TPA: hypothetical protein ACOEGC_004668 [Enterobacter kobei]
MKLIDILVQELPKRGGWIKGHYQCAQDKNGEVCFYTKGKIHLVRYGMWSIPGDSEATHDGESRVVTSLADDYAETIVTCDEYESALAASKPEWSGNGLPPVGMEIEYKFTKVNYRTDFSRGKVLAYGMHNVFMEHWSSKNEFIQPLDKIEFRPIRSEEDKKRDEIIEALKEWLGHAHGLYDLMQIYHLLNNGKIPHIRID